MEEVEAVSVETEVVDGVSVQPSRDGMDADSA